MALAVPPAHNLGNAAKRVDVAAAGPWKSWPRMSRWARAIRFMETYCRAPKGAGHGKPLALAPFQKEFLEEILADGVDAGVLTTPRGNGKSTFGGGLAVWAVFDDDETGSPQVPVIATKITQAVRSCYGVAASMIKAEPELISRALIYTGIASPRVFVHFNEGELFPTANDPDGLQGLDYSLALFDEIGFQPLESWDSLRYASGKRERSLALGLGTKGLDEDNALEQLRKALREGQRIPGFVFREYAAADEADIDDRTAWRRASPAIAAGFLRESAIETDLALTRAGKAAEAHFRLFRMNQRVAGVSSWLGEDGAKLWAGLQDDWQLAPGEPTWAGVDVGLKRDSTAVVAMQRRPDGRLHPAARFWIPTGDRPVDATDVMQHLRELAELYELRAVSFDPRFFDVPAKMLADEGLTMVQVDQSVERMTRACGSALELVKSGGLAWGGNPDDEILRTHVLNAEARFNERGFTLQKSKSHGRIDGCIALILAADQALHDVADDDEILVAFG